jgi:hypothetical protein
MEFWSKVAYAWDVKKEKKTLKNKLFSLAKIKKLILYLKCTADQKERSIANIPEDIVHQIF